MKANWLLAAMTDDNLVAELLLGLHRPDSRRVTPAVPLPLPPLDWGIRQPRSKAAASNDSTWRRSPTTPLSWTEESSPPLFLPARFKVWEWNQWEGGYKPFLESVVPKEFTGSATTDTTNSASANKRSRRKKTFAELREEESSLLKEREHLNKQLASLQLGLEEQISLNKSLKRVKLDVHAQTATVNKQIRPSSYNGEPEIEASTSKSPWNASKKLRSDEISALDDDFSPVLNGSSIEQPCIFVLPDLNMTPESITEMS